MLNPHLKPPAQVFNFGAFEGKRPIGPVPKSPKVRLDGRLIRSEFIAIKRQWMNETRNESYLINTGFHKDVLTYQ
jgi:hypothetical protein